MGIAVPGWTSISKGGDGPPGGERLTVEPSLYYPELGGVRLEDLLVVRGGGSENLTNFEKRLIL